MAAVEQISRVSEENRSQIHYLITKIQNEFLNPEYIAANSFSQEGENLVLEKLFRQKFGEKRMVFTWMSELIIQLDCRILLSSI